MNSQQRQLLVSRWIERQTKALVWDKDLVLHRQDLHRETEDQLDDIASIDPEEYWELLLDALHTNQSDEVLQALSARLLLLLETEPERFITLVEAQAEVDAQFKELLSWLLPSEPTNELWSRVRKAAGTVPW